MVGHRSKFVRRARRKHTRLRPTAASTPVGGWNDCFSVHSPRVAYHCDRTWVRPDDNLANLRLGSCVGTLRRLRYPASLMVIRCSNVDWGLNHCSASK
jgi:hypothetical protein